MKAGYRKASQIYDKALKSKKYGRDFVDCFFQGHPKEIKKIRAFWWEHLALQDENERFNLIQAYKKGDLVDKDINRARFWEEYNNLCMEKINILI